MGIIMKITIVVVCMFAVSIIVVGGCSLFKSKTNPDYRNSKDWEKIENVATPWNAENRLAEYWWHETHPFIAPDVRYYKYWTTKNNHLLDIEKLIKRFDKYLLSSKLSTTWPDSKGSVGNIILKDSPYRIIITSIEPDIIFMINSKQQINNFGFFSSIVGSAIGTGTKLPYGNKIIAIDLSDNTQQDVTIPDNENTYTFKFSKCNIVLTKNGDTWDTKRIDK